MKKKLLIIPILAIIFIFTLLPIGSLNADPGNLVKNSNFNDGSANWAQTGSVVFSSGKVYTSSPGSVEQFIDTSNKNLKFSFDVNPEDYGAVGYILAGFELYKNIVYLGGASNDYSGLSLDAWHSKSFKISDCWRDSNGTNIPDFDEIGIWVYTDGGAKAYFDNIKLKAPEKKAEVEPAEKKAKVEPVWIRTMVMTCYQVWVNSDNAFEMVFWYPYRDNNWVKIYEMGGMEVYSIDMPLDNPHIIVDLPNGMYTVKTFNDDPATPIQTFVIGK